MSKRYYTLIQCADHDVYFYDCFNQEYICTFKQVFSWGLIEFFRPQDIKTITEQSKLDEQKLIVQLDNSPVKVPYSRYGYLPFFTFIVLAAQVLASLVSMQRIEIFEQTFFGSFLILPFAFVATDLVNELYGYEVTKRMIRQCASVLLLIAAAIALIKLCVAQSVSAANNTAWMFINVSTSKRLFFYAISLLTADTLNAWFFHRLRFWLTNRSFWLRSILSTSISRIVYSTITATLLYSTGRIHAAYQTTYTKYFKIVFIGLEFSIIYLAFLMIPMYLICNFIRGQDYQTSTQPQLCVQFA